MRRTIAGLAVLLILALAPLIIAYQTDAQVAPQEVSAVSAFDLSDTPAGVMLANDQLDLSLTVLCSDSFCVDIVAEAREASVDYHSMISTARASEPEQHFTLSYVDGVENT